MRDEPAYVVGGALPRAAIDEIRGGKRPAFEFSRFHDRNGGALLSASDVAPWPSWLGPVGRRAASLKLPLAHHVGRISARYTAIVASGEDIGIPLAMTLALRRSATPVFMLIHGHYFGGRKFAAVAPLIRRMRNVHLLGLSDAIRDQAITAYGFSRDRCHGVGYGVDTTYFASERGDTGAAPPFILAAGLANRDYQTLMAAVAGLPVRVRIAAGSTWDKTGIAERGPATPDNVEIRPARDYSDLRDLYARASFVVVPMHPAMHACGYAVIAEAMAMGKAVIASRLAAPCDFFEDGVHGCYVTPNDVADLRRRILAFSREPDLVARFGAASRLTMRRRFGLDAFCERIEGVVRAAAPVR